MRTYQYLKVWIKGKRPIILEIISDKKRFLYGTEVNRQGDEIIRNNTKQGYFIEKSIITKTKTMKMSRKYGELELVR